MRTLFFLPSLALTTTAIATTAFAQNSEISLNPDTTSFATRGGIGTGTGETLMGLHSTHWRGIGDNGTQCEYTGFRSVVQDQNQASQEQFFWVIRSGSDATGPTTGNAGLLARLGPVAMPSSPAGGAAAWNIGVTLTSPLAVPCGSFVAVGLEIPAAPSWPSDGMSSHAADAAASDQHVNAGDTAWQIVGSATSASHPFGKISLRYAVRVASASLQMGVNGKYGNGGLFPVTGGNLSARVENGNPNGLSLLYVDPATTPGFTLFPATTRIYLGQTLALLVSTTTLDSNGDGVHPLAPMPTVPSPVTLYFQSASTGANPKVTNLTATTAN